MLWNSLFKMYTLFLHPPPPPLSYCPHPSEKGQNIHNLSNISLSNEKLIDFENRSKFYKVSIKQYKLVQGTYIYVRIYLKYISKMCLFLLY
jgi:hypothetical protein